VLHAAVDGSQELPIRSALAFSLDLGGKNLGAVVLYSDRPNYFTKNLIDIGTILANHAALALDLAHNAARDPHRRSARLAEPRAPGVTRAGPLAAGDARGRQCGKIPIHALAALNLD
jgi:GAF domain-containing protein